MSYDSGKDYLIGMHLNLCPYKLMKKSKALKEIKRHCNIPSDYISKYEASETCQDLPEDDLPSFEGNTSPENEIYHLPNILDNLMSYMNITRISEEEDVYSGSEEHYINKWKERPPYNEMTDTDAETLIKSKLNIVHRNRSSGDPDVDFLISSDSLSSI